MRSRYITIALLVLFASCNSANNQSKSAAAIDTGTQKTEDIRQIPSSRLLIPGKSAGAITINQKSEELFKLLGKADSTDAAMGKSFAFWKEKNGHVLTVYSETNLTGTDEFPRVKQVRITSDNYQTSGGIQVGSSLTEIRKQYPDVSKAAVYYTSKKEPIYIFRSIKSGISFDIEGERAIAITIHQAGTKSTATYIPLHPNVKLLK
jgi:hypothetical protein